MTPIHRWVDMPPVPTGCEDRGFAVLGPGGIWMGRHNTSFEYLANSSAAGNYADPTVSPDFCDVLATYIPGTGGGNNYITLIPTDGTTGTTDIAAEPDVGAGGTDVSMAPRWSPDGTQVVFAGLAGTNTLTGNTKIWIVDRDGSNLTAIYDEPFAVFGPVVYGTARCPQFSDDGTKIMFLRDGEVTPITGGTTTQRQIYTMDPDGSNLVQVALTTAYTSSVAGYTSHIPCWLSGTTTIVYYDTSTGDQTSGYGEWWMVEADGTGATLLYTDPESTASYTATGGGPWGPTAFASLPDASGALALQWFPGDTLYFDQRLGFVDFFGGGWFEISPTEVSAGFQYNINVPVFEKDGRIWWDDGMLGSGGNGVCSVLLDGSNFTVEDNSETWFWF